MNRNLILGFSLAAALCALAVPALAGPRDDVLFGISRCGGISNDRTWLDCVYGAAQPMRAQLGLQPAPLSQQKLVPPAVPGMAPPPAQFFGAQASAAPAPAPESTSSAVAGFFSRMVTPSHDAAELPTKLASYKFDAGGHFIVTLANGETWKQDTGDSSLAHWTRAAATYTVQIVPSASDYYFLKMGPDQYMVFKG